MICFRQGLKNVHVRCILIICTPSKFVANILLYRKVDYRAKKILEKTFNGCIFLKNRKIIWKSKSTLFSSPADKNNISLFVVVWTRQREVDGSSGVTIIWNIEQKQQLTTVDHETYISILRIGKISSKTKITVNDWKG